MLPQGYSYLHYHCGNGKTQVSLHFSFSNPLSAKGENFIRMNFISLFSGKTVLFTIWLLFSNPFVPDWGLQLMVSVVIGLLLPEIIVNPLDNLISRIPGVTRFKDYLHNHERLKGLYSSKSKRLQQIIPRTIAGYVFTYLIGWTALLFWYVL